MATVSTVAASLAPWLAVQSRSIRSPSASLVYLGGSTRSSFSLSTANASTGPAFLQSSFVPSSSSLASTSPYSGRSLLLNLTCNIGVRKDRGFRLVVRAGKAALCLTKRNRSRKSLARTHGFRRRMRTPGGRAMMKRRRAKGRRVLCTKTNPNSGKLS